jgi:hypothetical protein
MAITPFHATLAEVVRADLTVSEETITRLMGYLSSQEDKVRALRAGLVPSLFALYFINKSESTRHKLIRMLKSLVLLLPGREATLRDVGVPKLLDTLRDESAACREEACEVIEALSRFADSSRELHRDRLVYHALVTALNDPERRVCRAAVLPLARLSEVDKGVDVATVQRLVTLLKDTASCVAREDQRAAEALLLCLCNISTVFANKETCIAAGAVAASAGFLAHGNRELQRGATAVLMLLSTSLRGKEAEIDCAGVCETLSRLAADDKGDAAIRTNAEQAVQNLCESPRGLAVCGASLVSRPERACAILGVPLVVRVLQSLFSSRRSEDRERALYALDCVLDMPDGPRHALDCLEIVHTLTRLLLDWQGDELRERVTVACLVRLCAQNSALKMQLRGLAARDSQLREALLFAGSGELFDLADLGLWTAETARPSASDIAARRARLRAAAQTQAQLKAQAQLQSTALAVVAAGSGEGACVA